MIVRILLGHVLDKLATLPNESVHCVVTSPPYYGLRDYGIEPQVWGGDPGCEHSWNEETLLVHQDVGGNWTQAENGLGIASGIPQTRFRGDVEAAGKREFKPVTRGSCLRCNAWRGSLGLEPTPALYIEHMVTVFREIKRVLRKDGTLWLNIGDSYAGSASKGKLRESKGWCVGSSETLSSQRGSDRNGMGAVPGCKPKDLLGVPWMLAFALRDDGWWLRSEITWAKKAPMPESATDRPTTATEKVFLLTKSGDSTYWTHRDHEGSQTRPSPDYRWVDHDSDDAETDVEPPNWRTVLAGCARQSNLTGGAYAPPGQTAQSNARDGKRWSRINLWDAHDYFYDAEAVKEEAEESSGWSKQRATGQNTWKYNDTPERVAATGQRVDSSTLGIAGKRNMRNFCTSPYPDAHFATFVPEIPRRAILAGTSEKGVCPKCAAPWERVIESTQQFIRPATTNKKHWMAENPQTRRIDETIDWRPTCKCDAGEPIPATVLDPFLGAGTTGLTRRRL